MTTPAQTLKTRAATLAREAAELSAATREADSQVKAALMKYAAGTAERPEVQQAQEAHRAALSAEQAHGAALDMLESELAAQERAEQEAALVASLDATRAKSVLLIVSALRRQEAAEREMRAATYATRSALATIEAMQAVTLPDGYRLLALRGLGPDTTQHVPTQAQRDEMSRLLAPWRLERGSLPSPPPELFAAPSNPANSTDDHARRWSTLLALLDDLEGDETQ